jgi:hypothetical protein
MANMGMIVEVYYTETVNINTIQENGLGYIEEKIQVAVFGEQHLSLYIKSGRSEE